MRSLSSRNDLLGKLHYFAWMHRQLRGRQPVLVYSLGKAGTTSLANVIERATGRPTIHCHRVDRRSARRALQYGPQARSAQRPTVAWRGEYVRYMLRFQRPDRRWEIVCGVRDPVARMISTLFQVAGSLELFDPSDDDADLDLIVRQMIDLFADDRADLDWFSGELGRVTGIDVFASDFDTRRGWQTYENERFRVLVLRFENLASDGPSALRTFFALDEEPELPKRNVGESKVYAPLYRRFKAEAPMPVWVLDHAYGSALAQHFYTESERRGFRASWEP